MARGALLWLLGVRPQDGKGHYPRQGDLNYSLLAAIIAIAAKFLRCSI
jgi:hypothetical protein